MTTETHLMPGIDNPAPKAYLRGTHRVVDPAETVARVRELMPAMGITRIANVTGLDHIGIPVVMVCRPNARSLAVSQGKGVDLPTAMASGLMESFELYHAEHVALPLRLASFGELRRSYPTVDVSGLPRFPQSLFHPHRTLLWIEGYDLLQGKPKWVPFESVHTNFTVEVRGIARNFIPSSNGLASGNHLLEAISQAICEVIERDATTLFGLAGRAAREDRRIAPDTVDDQLCRTVLDAFERADVAVGIWDTTSDVGVPTFRCLITQRTINRLRPLPNAGGFGCHPARQIALLRALTEAAQGRLTLISGARDDMFRDAYELGYSPDALVSGQWWLEADGPLRDFHEVPSFEGSSFEQDVAWELQRLREIGISEAVVVDLTKPEFGLPVVKVIIPGLEFVDSSTHRGSHYQYGERAKRIIEEREWQEALGSLTRVATALSEGSGEPEPEMAIMGPRTGEAYDAPTATPRIEPEGVASHLWRLSEAPGGLKTDAFIFTGPTLPAEEASQYLDAVYLPPVSQGDIYRVALMRPRAIGIIDGYFERVPAVWHKEILWAMSQGIHVFGSASMGALRAAELAPFGMEGVGLVFEAYRDCTLEDDDEVAVLHGPEEVEYRAASDAMVDIRSTLRRAVTEGVISDETRAGLEAIAKSLHYAERTFSRMLKRAQETVGFSPDLDSLRAWLPCGRVHQKREDAVAMLQLIRERLEAGLEPKRVCFELERTTLSERARERAGQFVLHGTGVDALRVDMLLEELRLDPSAYMRAQEAATARLFLRREAESAGLTPSREATRQRLELLRAAHGLQGQQAQDLSPEQLDELLREEAAASTMQAWLQADLAPHLIDHLRLSGEYAKLLARAYDKQRTLESTGRGSAGLQDAGLTEQELLEWYFRERVGRPVPEDITNYARALAFTDRRDFTQAVLHEFCYLKARE